MSRLLLALVALLAGACNAPYAVWSTPGLEADTAEAVEAWNAALAEHCPQHPGLTLAGSRDAADVTVAWGTVPGYDYGASETHDQIVVDPRFKSARAGLVAHLVAHELGHAMGAHHDRTGTLMQPVAPRGVDGAIVTKRDVEQICGEPKETM